MLPRKPNTAIPSLCDERVPRQCGRQSIKQQAPQEGEDSQTEKHSYMYSAQYPGFAQKISLNKFAFWLLVVLP